ncbi:DUF4365 domain-containing protein [Mesorhizobium sp.]|jgi:hypothetical protein|uniref:DUF4365 domain-containing protein n=1 Tax=Mesorhizobium sp. TaxID=1871066 RepID=UPI0039C91A22
MGDLVLSSQHIQERLSLAYIHAVSGRAGVNVSGASVHDYGVDGRLQPLVRRGGRTVENGFNLDFQAKSTTRWQISGDTIVYDLEAKTYNDIVSRDPLATPLVLLLMCLPENDIHWLAVDENSAVLRNCCYWMRFAHGPVTRNVSTVRIYVPRANVLNVEGLRGLLRQVQQEAQGRAI